MFYFFRLTILSISKKSRRVAFLFFLFSNSLLFSQESNVSLKFASLAPKSSSWGRCLSGIAREMYKSTDKKIRIKVYYGGQMGDEAEIAQKMQVSQLDGAAFTGNGLGHICPEARVLEIPFLFDNDFAKTDKIYQEMGKKLQPHFKKKKLELLGLSETGFAYFFTQKKVDNFNDLRQQKMWSWKGDKLAAVMMKAMDIPAIPISFIEVLSSLQTGIIDSFYCTPYASISVQWNTQSKYMIDLPIANVSGGMVISQSGYDKLNSDEKKLLKQICSKYVKKLIDYNRLEDARAIEEMKKNGLQVIKIKYTAEELNKIQKRVIDSMKKDSEQAKLIATMLPLFEE